MKIPEFEIKNVDIDSLRDQPQIKEQLAPWKRSFEELGYDVDDGDGLFRALSFIIIDPCDSNTWAMIEFAFFIEEVSIRINTNGQSQFFNKACAEIDFEADTEIQDWNKAYDIAVKAKKFQKRIKEKMIPRFEK